MERNVIHLEKTCEDNNLNGQRLIKYRILVRVYMTKQPGEEIYCRKYNTFTKEQLTRNRNVYSGRTCQQNIKKKQLTWISFGNVALNSIVRLTPGSGMSICSTVLLTVVQNPYQAFYLP